MVFYRGEPLAVAGDHVSLAGGMGEEDGQAGRPLHFWPHPLTPTPSDGEGEPKSGSFSLLWEWRRDGACPERLVPLALSAA